MISVCLRRSFVVTVFSVLLLVEIPARAQNPPAEGPTTSAPAESPREQTIYIPYAKLREVFEREGRGVFLPYEQFQALWRAAREAATPPAEPLPPAATLISEMSSEAQVGRDVMSVSAQLRIEVLREGWHEIPLRLADAAITSATIDGQPARLMAGPDGYRLLLEKRGKAIEQVELKLEFAKAIAKSPGQNSVTFEAPQAPVSRWRVRVPGAGVRVNIQPLIAATEVPLGTTPATEPTETLVLAFVGAAPTVRINWTPRAEGAQGLQALASVQAVQRIWIEEGVVRTRVHLSYEITRAAVDRLQWEVPADQKVVNVFDANVRQWSVQSDGDVQTVTAELFEPAQGVQNVLLELEQFLAADTREPLKAPVVRALGVSRQQGLVAVTVAEGLRVEAARHSGLLQVDAGETPPAPGEAAGAVAWVLSYRYATLPFDLALTVEKTEPQIGVDALVEASLEPDHLSLAWRGVYTIEKAGVFRLELEVPAGYEVRGVRGTPVADAAPAVVESHHLEGEAPLRLVVNLGRKAQEKVGLAVDLYKRLDAPDLLSPTGKSAEIAIRVPRVTAAGLERASGRLIVYPAESLRINPAALEGLRTVPLAEALAGMEAPANSKPPRSRPASGLAFAFAADPATLTLKAERRKPHLTVRQLVVVRVESGVAKYEATFAYSILYSAVPYLRIDIPADLKNVVQNQSPGVREAVLESPAEPAAPGRVALGLRGEIGFKGDVTIKLAWETKIAALEIGQSLNIVVPQLTPMEVDRAWGQIAVAKAETIDIHPTGGKNVEAPVGLRPIDPQRDLVGAPEALKTEGAARAFEFHGDWTLGLSATRYELEEVKRTSIERALVRVVATRSGQVSAQALYRMRSAHQRLAVHLPDKVEFDTDPVRINGRPVALERGAQDEFFVPLVGQSADRAFVLELRYTVPAGGLRLTCPEFLSDPAVQKVCLCAYLPPEWALLGALGPWTDEVKWRWNELTGFEPLPLQQDLVGWVTEGVQVTGNPAETFQTDGRPYLFSSLGPAGSLRLVSIREWLLSVFVVVVVVLGGLLLLRSGATRRLLACAAAAIALVLLGVFLPTLLRQIVDGVLLSALVVVAIVWLVRYLAWTRLLDPRRLGQPAMAATAPAPPTPPPASASGGATKSAIPPTAAGGPSDEGPGGAANA